jgi:anti-sigma B factor antagonist
MTDAPVIDPDVAAVLCRREATCLTIALVGEIDIETAPRLQAAIDWIADSLPSDVTVDLSGTTFLDSTAMRFFVRLRKLVVGNGRDLALAAPQRAVARTLRHSGLDRLFDIAPAGLA